MAEFRQPTFIQRLLKAFGATKLGVAIFRPTLHHLDRASFKLTNNQVAISEAATGVPCVTLTTTGAKSGEQRSVPLWCLKIDGNIILIASNYGRKNYPAWYHNLKAHPQATVTFDGQDHEYIAREIEGEERAKYWKIAVDTYIGYARYEERVEGRHVPVMLLEPVRVRA